MVESVEGTGRTVDEALERALDEIGLERDEVEVTVLSEGGSAGQARVVVTAREDLEDLEDEELDDADDELGDDEEIEEDELGDEVDEQPRGRPARTAPPARAQPRAAAPGGNGPDGAEAAGRATAADAEAIATLAEEILVELLDRMDLPSEVEVDDVAVDDGLPTIQLSIHGEFGGILIGRHGDTLGALQFLLGLMVGRRAGRRARVIVDVEGYRERRANLLNDLALRAAERAARYRQPIFMDPMAPGERRIVHLALQDHPAVQTHSIGEGDSRRVVVSPKQAQRFGGYSVE